MWFETASFCLVACSRERYGFSEIDGVLVSFTFEGLLICQYVFLFFFLKNIQ